MKNMKKYTDYFEIMGYKKFVLAVVLNSINDLLLSDDDAVSRYNGSTIDLREQAKAWVMEKSSAKSDAKKGLTFDDCMISIGLENSTREFMRHRIINEPEKAVFAFKSVLASMRSEEMAEINEETKDNIAMGRVAPSVGSFNDGWLFKTRSNSTESQDEADVWLEKNDLVGA